MNTLNMINNAQKFNVTANQFFHILFNDALKLNCGEIEIRGFDNGPRHQSYHRTTTDAANTAYNLCQSGLDVYFGVNPRVDQAGAKQNVHWLTAFHVEIDYGVDGHKKKPDYNPYEEALNAITSFSLQPTWINHSGGGFHCYWVLNDPVNGANIGLEKLENVNRALTAELKGDSGTHNINRILRVPGTYNLKLADNPREVTVISEAGSKYDLGVFKPMMDFEPKKKSVTERKLKSPMSQNSRSIKWDNKISSLSVSDRIKFLIINGNDGTYISRSETDQAVITALVTKGMNEADIKAIFQKYQIGEKYREHTSQGEYLKHNIERAKEFSNLNEEERQDPLFITGAIFKDKNDRYHLQIVPFQEYMNKKHMLKYLEKEKAFFRYNGQCYEQCHEERLNYLCQNEMGKHRDLFTKSAMSNFMHYSIADDLVDAEKAFSDQVRYLTM